MFVRVCSMHVWVLYVRACVRACAKVLNTAYRKLSWNVQNLRRMFAKFAEILPWNSLNFLWIFALIYIFCYIVYACRSNYYEVTSNHLFLCLFFISIKYLEVNASSASIFNIATHKNWGIYYKYDYLSRSTKNFVCKQSSGPQKIKKLKKFRKMSQNLREIFRQLRDV